MLLSMSMSKTIDSPEPTLWEIACRRCHNLDIDTNRHMRTAGIGHFLELLQRKRTVTKQKCYAYRIYVIIRFKIFRCTVQTSVV
jgi:hypothetical protein